MKKETLHLPIWTNQRGKPQYPIWLHHPLKKKHSNSILPASHCLIVRGGMKTMAIANRTGLCIWHILTFGAISMCVFFMWSWFRFGLVWFFFWWLVAGKIERMTWANILHTYWFATRKWIARRNDDAIIERGWSILDTQMGGRATRSQSDDDWSRVKPSMEWRGRKRDE